MRTIRLYEHPIAGPAQVFEAPSVGEWLLEHYGETPRLGIRVFVGEPSQETEITDDVEALITSEATEYAVLQTPGEGVSAGLIVSYVLTAVSIVSAYLAMPSAMPPNVNRTQQSPNNALGSRENQFRVLQRVEDIFGTVKSVPSMMMPTYYKYIENRKYEYGYYCIGRGYYDVNQIRDGDTLISEITGASAAIYPPFTSPNSGDAPVLQIGDPIIDRIVKNDRSNEVDGITLKPLNQLQLPRNAPYYFVPAFDGRPARIQQNWNAGTNGYTGPRGANLNSLVNPGDTIGVTMAPVPFASTAEATSDSAGFAYPLVQSEAGGASSYSDPLYFAHVGDSILIEGAAYTVTGHTTSDGNGLLSVSPVPPTNAEPALIHVSVVRNYSGAYSVSGVADGFIEVSAAWGDAVNALATIDVTSNPPVDEYTDWMTLALKERTELYINIVADQGMVKDDGGQSNCTVEFELTIEKLDPGTLAPAGVMEVVTTTISGSTTDEVDETVEHVTSWVGPARVRMRRTSQHDFDFQGNVVDEIKWADLYSVTPIDKAEFGNKTTIHTITQATNRATAVKTRQLNCLASRLIPTFDGSRFSGAFDPTGRISAGSIHASGKLVDIIASVSVDPKIGRRDLATEVDMAQIWGVQQQLDAWHPEAGQFNFTFDSDNTSFEETIQQIANAGFCIAYRQNGKIRLALDRPQATPATIFTHRNKKPRAETLTRTFGPTDDFDGVEFVYTDPDSNQPETIRLPLDGAWTKLKKFEIPGIRSFAQAWYRASREYYKLRGQRINIETSTTMDARALLPNARVDIVDNTRFKSFDGEVIAQDGLRLTLSQPWEYRQGEAHTIVLMRRDGTLQSIPVLPGANARQAVIAYPPGEAIVVTPDPDVGIRTIYSIASDSARDAMAYLVGEIDLSDGQYATVKAVNYSDSYYQADSLPVPDKAPIIN